jgi:long-chain acyl-CoA synthetase
VEVSAMSNLDSLEITQDWLRHYEPQVPKSLQLGEQLLVENLIASARLYPRRTAIRSTQGTLRYGELFEQVCLFAGMLEQQGLKPGDKVLVLLPNCLQLIIALYGSMWAGCRCALSSPQFPNEILEAQLKDYRPDLVVVPNPMSESLSETLKISQVEHILLSSGKEYNQSLQGWLRVTAGKMGSGSNHTMRWRRKMSEATPKLVPYHGDPHATAVILYTGGTTGAPRGVELSQAALNANARQIAAWDYKIVYGRERMLCTLPLTHSYGLTTCLNLSILTGTTLILCDSLSPAQVVSDCHTYSPSLLPGVPALYAELVNYAHKKRTKLSTIRSCISGAAPLPIELQEGFEKVTKGRLVEGYGLSEAGPVTHANPLYGKRKSGSIGIPLPMTEAVILDLNTGLPAKPGEVGELLVRGPQLMNGYYHNPDETAKVLKDGWLHTGDIVQLDGDGYFYLISRRVDCISREGTTIFPRDIEEIVHQHPSIKEVAVVAWPAPDTFTELGFAVAQGLRAYIAIKPNRQISVEDLEAFCRRHLPAGSVPDEWKVLTQLPRTPFGKLSRKNLYQG